MNDQESKFVKPLSLFSCAAALVGLYLASRYNYLLFHSLVEIFTVIVASGIFIIAWNTRRILNNNYFLLVGIASLFVGTIDLLHTLAYKGIGVFPGYGPNLATQLWIVGRYLQSFSLFAAPFLLGRKLRGGLAMALFLVTTTLLLAAVFGGVFPDCFVEGKGLTPFKKGSEYFISFMFLGALFFMRRKSEFFERQVLRLISAAIALFIAAELAFTIYTDVYGISNMVGHFLKLAGFFLIYKALIETGLVRPYDLLFREIKEAYSKLQSANEELQEQSEELHAQSEELQMQSEELHVQNQELARAWEESSRAEETLKKLNDELENRVTERTKELADTNHNLQLEIVERLSAQESVLRLNQLYLVLSETNQAIVRTKDRETLFNDICRIAVEDGSFKLAWVGLVDENNGALNVAASKGATGYLDDLKITITDEPAGIGPTGLSVREGSYYICNDFLGSPITRPWHERGRVHGFRASASIALKQEGRVIGAMTLYAEKKDFFDQQQVELLRQIGADVSFALDNIVRETCRQAAERALREETVERLRATETLREKEQMLIQQSRQAAMGEMIGNIAHQWRQPLNTLGLFTQRLGFFYGQPIFNQEFLDTSVAKSMEIIQHMSKTIDDFRNFFKPDKAKGDFNVSDAIKNTLSLLEGNFQNPSIHIEIIENDHPVINGYQNEFTQVLLNILTNARDAIIEREINDARVIITICSEDDCAVVTIADNAGGIPEEIINKVFDPYFTTKGPQLGTGVGLFMSKTIIEKNMGGRLAVRNTATGAEFRIEVGNGIQN